MAYEAYAPPSRSQSGCPQQLRVAALTHILMAKTTKAFEKLHVQQAATELQNIALKSKLESHTNKSKRERIEADANTRFANVEEIKRAQDKVAG